MLIESATQLYAELQQPANPQIQASALRRLKNQLIGHPQKKEIWVQRGVLDVLGRILKSHHHNIVHGNSADSEGRIENVETKEARQDVVLQAIIVIGSLAQGGPRFIAPLASTQIVPVLTSILNPSSSSSDLTLAALRVLNTIADSIALQHWQEQCSSKWPLHPLYSNQSLRYLARILEQNDTSPRMHLQVSLTAALIGKTCHEEESRKVLAASGLLEALAIRLVYNMVESSHELTAESQHRSQQQRSSSFASAKPTLAPILQAIASVVRSSPSRTARFLSAPAFSIFQSTANQRQWHTDASKTRVMQYSSYGDATIAPYFQDPSSRSLPPFGGLAVWGKPSSAKGMTVPKDIPTSNLASHQHVDERPVAKWLTHVIQVEQGVPRLMAAWLLAILFKEGLANEDCEKVLSMQLIPLIVRMLEPDSANVTSSAASHDDVFASSPQWLIKRLAPHVLALLVGDSKQLQLAASDAGAIKKLSMLLKQTFDTLPGNKRAPFWSPNGPAQHSSPSPPSSSSSILGPHGITLAAHQVLLVREAVLEALASMATQEDELRKLIIGNGIVQYIVLSLNPDPSTSSGEGEDSPTKLGNPTPVLMQACAAATALSRSVSTLRTSLIDAGLAKPIFALLHHPDIQVQIAATGATCNIVLEFSPMRQEMVEAGVLDVLCKQAHSGNLSLRLNSLWALKHLVHAASNTLRRKCLQNLGASWLKQIICNDVEAAPRSPPPSLAMGTPNAAGERVDLLNTEDDDDEVLMIDDESSGGRPETHENTNAESDADQALKHRKDSVFVQGQALDLVRNLISGPGSAEMVDHLFAEFGQQMLIDILTNLLYWRAADRRTQKRMEAAEPTPSGFRVHQASPPVELIAGVMHILVHLAGGGLPRHREFLLGQTHLMLLVRQHASHQDPEVRSAYAWLGINLTWIDDSSDKLNVRSRVSKLRKLGMVEKLESLQSDSNLDVRERAKTAVNQIRDAET